MQCCWLGISPVKYLHQLSEVTQVKNAFKEVATVMLATACIATEHAL